MTLTISDINSLDLNAYATKAKAFKRCVAQLRAIASDLQTQVVKPLGNPATWDSSVTADGQRVAHIHASTVHHTMDAFELAYITLDHLVTDLAASRKALNNLINDMGNDNITVADNGTVTVPVDPSTITNRVARIQAEYEGTADNYKTSAYGAAPGFAQALVTRAMQAFEQIDQNAAKVLNTVVSASSSIVVDKTNVALKSNVDASPKGIDALLALFGDPLKDLAENVKNDPGELERAKKMLERFNLAKELSTKEMSDLGKVLKGSTDQRVAKLGDFLTGHPSSEQLQEFLAKEGTPGFLGVSLLLNYLSYRNSAPSAAAVVESVATVGTSVLSASVAGGTTAAAIDVLLGGAENPVADGIALLVGFVAGKEAADAQTRFWEHVNKTLFNSGEDGVKLTAPDPLTLGPSPISAASGE